MNTVKCNSCARKSMAYATKRYHADEKLRTYFRKAFRKRTEARQELGLCTRCNAPAVTAYYCRKHQLDAVERMRKPRKKPLRGRVTLCSFCKQPGHRVQTCPVRFNGL